jgi:hypothetical protein
MKNLRISPLTGDIDVWEELWVAHIQYTT